MTGCAAPQLAAESLRLTTELLPEEAAAAPFDFPRSPLRAAVEAMGTVAAVAPRNERRRIRGPRRCTPRGRAGRNADRVGPSAGRSSTATSPKQGSRPAQRTALEALAAAARTPRLTLSPAKPRRRRRRRRRCVDWRGGSRIHPSPPPRRRRRRVRGLTRDEPSVRTRRRGRGEYKVLPRLRVSRMRARVRGRVMKTM